VTATSAVLDRLAAIRIIPVIAIEEADHAEPLAAALVEGGLPCAEITFRTAAAAEAIRRIAKAFPTLLLGAGTILTVDQVKTAVDAGAQFIVSPGLGASVVRYCQGGGIPITPGAVTPTEVSNALEMGIEVVKFFPAATSGGVEHLKALAAPFRGVRFIPTGGITEANLPSYLALPSVLACGGSWMVKPEMIRAGRFEDIRILSQRAVQMISPP
jgi:2-dehydro-3-deoxyphosphogluconate aldolase/(4S)-4-hydroxy-2-oxoglutarate aldolase